MSQQIFLYDDARRKMKKGVDTLANAVKVTLGPKGRNVIVGKKSGAPVITKDGFSVVNEIRLEDAIEDVGAQLVKELINNTLKVSRDGSTTATVLAQALISEGLKKMSEGANPIHLKAGIDKAVKTIHESLRNQSVEIDSYSDVRKVAGIFAGNDDSVGELIAEALIKVGKRGVITVRESRKAETTIDIVEGMRLNQGYISPDFVTNSEKMQVELENPYILLHEKKLSNIQSLRPVIEAVRQSHRPLLIIAEDLEGQALSTLVAEHRSGAMKIAAVKTPGLGDIRNAKLGDISVLTAGELISEDLGIKLENVTLFMLGEAKGVIITDMETTIMDGAGSANAIKGRVEQIKAQIEHTNSNHEIERLQERIAELSSGIAILNVGAMTETELKEKKDRIDNALYAMRFAVEEGIVPGGGVAYIRSVPGLASIVAANEDEQKGIQIVASALEEPLRQIVVNSGMEENTAVQKVQDGTKDFGFNADTEVYENLLSAGVIDLTKVLRVALENAASIAGIFLTTECVTYDET